MRVLSLEKEAVITAVAFTPDATAVRLTATRRSGSASVIDTHLREVATGARSDLLVGGEINLDTLCDHPSRRWLFGRTGGNGVAGYHLTNGTTVTEQVVSYPTHLAFTPDGRTLLYGWCDTRASGSNGYASRQWSDEGVFGPGFSVVVDTSSGYFSTCCGVAPLADSRRFVTVNWRGQPRLAVRSVATGAVIGEVTIEARSHPILAVARDGNLVAVAVSRSVFVFAADDLTTPRRVLKNDARSHFTALAFHPSGRYLAATSNDATVKLYDTTSWQVAQAFDWGIGRVRSICFSRDGALGAAGGDQGQIVVWDADL